MIFCFNDELKYATERYSDYLNISNDVLIAVNFSELVGSTKNIDGYATPLAQDNTYKISIRYNDSCSRDPLRVLAHEMIHIKQFVDKKLVLLDNNRASWLGEIYYFPECYSSNFYTSVPWELEAYYKEFRLYKRYKNEVRNIYELY